MQNRSTFAAGGLDRELRGTLAALDELGPGYEPELAAALVQRLQEHGYIAPRRSSAESRPDRPRLPFPVIIAAAVAAAMLFSAAARPHTGYWGSRYHRAWGYHAFTPGQPLAPVQPVAPVPPLAPAPPAPPVAPFVQ